MSASPAITSFNRPYHFVKGTASVSQLFFVWQWFHRILPQVQGRDWDDWTKALKRWIAELNIEWGKVVLTENVVQMGGQDPNQDLCSAVTRVLEEYLDKRDESKSLWESDDTVLDVTWNETTSCEMSVVFERVPTWKSKLASWRRSHSQFFEDSKTIDAYRLVRIPHTIKEMPIDLKLAMHASIEKDLAYSRLASHPHTSEFLGKGIEGKISILSTSKDKEKEEKEKEEKKKQAEKSSDDPFAVVPIERIEREVGETGILRLLQVDQDQEPLSKVEAETYKLVTDALFHPELQGIWCNVPPLPSISAKSLTRLRLPTSSSYAARDTRDYWLDDNLIKLGLHILEDMIVPNTPDDGVLLFDSSFYTLCAPLSEDNLSKRKAKVEKRIRIVQAELKRLVERRPNVKQIRRIMFVIPHQENHWIVAELLPASRTRSIFDPMPSEAHLGTYQNILTMLGMWYDEWCTAQQDLEWAKSGLPQLLRVPSWQTPDYFSHMHPDDMFPIQGDSINCGVYAVKIVEYRIRRLPLDLPAKSIGVMRQRLLLNAVRMILSYRELHSM